MTNFFATLSISGLILALGLSIISQRAHDLEEKMLFWRLSVLLFLNILQISLLGLNPADTVVLSIMRAMIIIYTLREGYTLFKR